MAIGRIGTTPTLRTRWSKQPSGGTTSLSGLDDNSVSLVYDVGYEAVYRNGVLLSRGNDYTATSGTSITLIDATIAGDVIEVFANQSIPLTDTYTQTVADGKFINNTLVDAKGDILTATADNTPARLAVGSNDQVLTADSSTATGLKWATPAAGGMTLLNAGGTTLTGASVTISSIPATYNNLQIVVRNFRLVDDNIDLRMRINGDSTANRHRTVDVTEAFAATFNSTSIRISSVSDNGATANGLSVTTLYDYANTSTFKISQTHASIMHNATTPATQFNMLLTHGYYNQTGAVTSLVFFPETGNFTSGTLFVYGVK